MFVPAKGYDDGPYELRAAQWLSSITGRIYEMTSVGIARAIGLGSVALIGVLSLIPGIDVPRTGSSHVTEHFAAYFLTALILGLGYRRSKTRLSITYALILLAGGMEIAQFWAIARGPHIGEWLAGAIGGASGMLVTALLDYLADWQRGRRV